MKQLLRFGSLLTLLKQQWLITKHKMIVRHRSTFASSVLSAILYCECLICWETPWSFSNLQTELKTYRWILNVVQSENPFPFFLSSLQCACDKTGMDVKAIILLFALKKYFFWHYGGLLYLFDAALRVGCRFFHSVPRYITGGNCKPNYCKLNAPVNNKNLIIYWEHHWRSNHWMKLKTCTASLIY